MTKHVSAGRHFDVNEVRSDNHEHIVAFCDLLGDALWSFIAASDGTTMSGVLRNNVARWSNSNAWEHWRDPGGRDLVIQRGTTDRSWRGYVGQRLVPFTGGTATAAPTDVATRMQFIGASDGFNTGFFAFTATTDRVHMMVDGTGRGTGANVYSFYLQARNAGTGNAGTPNFMRYALTSPADGVIGDADAEPWLVTVGLHGVSSQWGWYRAGLSGMSRRSSISLAIPVSVVWGTNPYTGERDIGSYLAHETTASFLQRKGYTEDLWIPVGVAEADMDTYNLAIEGRSKARFSSTSILPWPHGVTPVVP